MKWDLLDLICVVCACLFWGEWPLSAVHHHETPSVSDSQCEKEPRGHWTLSVSCSFTIKVDALPPAMWPPDSELPAVLELQTSAWREAPSCFVLLSDKQAAARCLCLGPSSTGPHAHSRFQLPLWFYWRGK